VTKRTKTGRAGKLQLPSSRGESELPSRGVKDRGGDGKKLLAGARLPSYADLERTRGHERGRNEKQGGGGRGATAER